MGHRNDIDWQKIERDYRLGQLTLRQLAKLHDVSASAISRKAEKENWAQDLSREVKEKTRAALATADATESNTQSVDVAVQTNVAIVREHRRDIREGREMARTMMAELREATVNHDEIEAAIHDETNGDKAGKRRAMMLRAIALPSRASVLVNLGNATKTYIGLERQAFNLDEAEEKDSSAETMGAAAVDEISRLLADLSDREGAGGNPGAVEPGTG